jgi:hypothetical protein
MKVTPITGFLHLRPVLLGPGEEQRAGERRGERRRLHAQPVRLEAEPVGEDHAQPRDLRHREIDEDDAAREHLDAERRVRRDDQQPGDERRPENAEVERAHFAAASSRSSVSS